MLSYANLFRSIQGSIASYQDIGTIYGKLETQGHLYKLTALIAEVFEEEHEFTLNELKKYSKDSKNLNDKFIQEQYELNAGIFRRNLAIIAQNIVDETGRFYLQKFKLISQNPKLAQEDLNDQTPDIRISNQDKPQIRTDLPEIREETENDRTSPGSVKRQIIPDDQPRSPIDSEYRAHLHTMDLDKKRRSYGHIREVNPETLQNSRTFEVSNTHHRPCNLLEVQELVSKQQKNEPQSPLIKNQSVSPHPSINKKDRALSDFNANIERSRSQAAVQSQIVSQGYNKLTPAEKSKYRHENEKPNWEDDNRVKPFSNEESDVFFFQSVTNSRESSIARDSSSNFFSKQASPSHEVDSHRMKSNRSNSGDFYASKKSLPKNQRNLAMQQIDERNISKEVSSPTEANMSHNSNHYGTVSFAKYLTNPSQPSQHDQGVEHDYSSYTKNQPFKKNNTVQRSGTASGYYHSENGFQQQQQQQPQQPFKEKSPRSTFGKSPKQPIFSKPGSDNSANMYFSTPHYMAK